MKKAIFQISQMDCPSEEQMIRMALANFSQIEQLEFDIPNRNLTVFLKEDVQSIEYKLASLSLGAKLVKVENHCEKIVKDNSDSKRRLIIVLAINFTFFVIEMLFGIVSQSMGLIADSLDMLADSFVYGLSLYAINHIESKRKRIAKLSGYFQISLALFGITEVIRRFIGVEGVPDFYTMASISGFALIGNLASLFVLSKTKDQGVHLKASWIFTSNDVLANIGVIIAAAFVYLTSSKLPDLIVGGLIFVIVANGGIKILRIAK